MGVLISKMQEMIEKQREQIQIQEKIIENYKKMVDNYDRKVEILEELLRRERSKNEIPMDNNASPR